MSTESGLEKLFLKKGFREDEALVLERCAGEMGSRAALGVCTALTLMVGLGAIRGPAARPLPATLRIFGGGFLAVSSGYLSAMTAVGNCVHRIRSLPDSKLQESLQTMVEDWTEAKKMRDQLRASKEAQKVELEAKVVDDSNNGDPAAASGSR